MNNKLVYCAVTGLIFICLLSGCYSGRKDNFPQLPDQTPDSVIIMNGILGVNLPPVEDKKVINELIELIGNIKYIAEDSTEIIGGRDGITFVYSDSTIVYEFITCNADAYVSVRVNESSYIQYKIEPKNGFAIYDYLHNYVTEHSE
jgi:hypothetical protein